MYFKSEKEKKIGECVVCLDHSSCYTLVPCGHLICKLCYNRNQNNHILRSKCPFCRKKYRKNIKWTIIAGTANLHWQALKEFTNHSQMDITLIKRTNRIAALMANHDFAIGAAGSMAWERACIGLPSLTIPIEYNQRSGIEHIRHFALGETLEVSEITATTLVIALKQLKHQANDYLERNHTMVDGLGVARLMKMLSLN